MNDLTLLYYTANRIHAAFGQAVREELFAATRGEYPLVCVSQKPFDLERYGNRIQGVNVGPIGASIYNCYRQILVGAKAATTSVVAMCEDDTLYAPAQFALCPPRDDTFYYNRNRFVLTRKLSDDKRRRSALFYFRERTQMAMCVCSRQLLIDTLEERFTKWPEPIADDVAKRAAWGEPGRYERNMGLPRRQREYFETTQPCVTINHSASLMGRRLVKDTDIIKTDLEPWGNADELWRRICGE